MFQSLATLAMKDVLLTAVESLVDGWKQDNAVTATSAVRRHTHHSYTTR